MQIYTEKCEEMCTLAMAWVSYDGNEVNFPFAQGKTHSVAWRITKTAVPKNPAIFTYDAINVYKNKLIINLNNGSGWYVLSAFL